MSALNDMGVNIVESDEGDDDEPETDNGIDEPGEGGETLRRREEEGNGRPHRRSGAHVSARDGRGGTALARGRDRHRQAHRGRPRHHDLGPLREPDHLQRHHPLVERPQCRPHAAARDPRPRGDALQGPDPRAGRGRREREWRHFRIDRRPLLQGGRGGRGSRRGRGGRGQPRRAPRAAAGRGGGRGQHPLASPRWKRR